MILYRWRPLLHCGRHSSPNTRPLDQQSTQSACESRCPRRKPRHMVKCRCHSWNLFTHDCMYNVHVMYMYMNCDAACTVCCMARFDVIQRILVPPVSWLDLTDTGVKYFGRYMYLKSIRLALTILGTFISLWVLIKTLLALIILREKHRLVLTLVRPGTVQHNTKPPYYTSDWQPHVENSCYLDKIICVCYTAVFDATAFLTLFYRVIAIAQ